MAAVGEDGFRSLPDDIFLEILEKLPVNSLSRFRCVSKQWYFFISQIVTRTKKVIVRSVSSNHRTKGRFSFKSISQTSSEVKDIDVIVGKGGVKGRFYPHITGSCNGLLLIRVGIDFFLWNPSVSSTHGRLSYDPISDYRHKYIEQGLCFDTTNNDYKVVLVLTKGCADLHIAMVVVGCFRTKSWRKFDFPHNVTSAAPGPVLHNHLHWLLNDKTWKATNIVYFDPQVDEFVDLPFPSPEEGSEIEMYLTEVLDGCLCIIKEESGVASQVLAMKEYGVKESWTILFKFNHGPSDHILNATPLFFTDETKWEVMMHLTMEDGDEAIAAYDINKALWKDAVVLVNIEDPYDFPIVYDEISVRPTAKRDTGNIAKLIWKVNEFEGHRTSNI